MIISCIGGGLIGLGLLLVWYAGRYTDGGLMDFILSGGLKPHGMSDVRWEVYKDDKFAHGYSSEEMLAAEELAAQIQSQSIDYDKQGGYYNG